MRIIDLGSDILYIGLLYVMTLTSSPRRTDLKSLKTRFSFAQLRVCRWRANQIWITLKKVHWFLPMVSKLTPTATKLRHWLPSACHYATNRSAAGLTGP